MKQVFVSYSRRNLEVVTQLIQDLNAVGVATWHDQTLTGGQRWWDNILKNIRDCDIFVFALSPESLDSEACKSELGYVAKLGKPILPVMVADGVNCNLLSHPLAEIQVTDCRGGEKQVVLALMKSIFATSDAPPLPDPLPEPPPVPMSYMSNLSERIDSSAPLSSQEQITLLFELEQELEEAHSRTEVRDLLLRLKRRDDLLAKISTKIDDALATLEDLEKKVAELPTKREEAKRDKQVPAQMKFCAKCGTRNPADAGFCHKCGTPMGVNAQPSAGGAPATPMPGAKSRRYASAGADIPGLIADLKVWLVSQNFEAQQLNTEDGGVMMQIKKQGGWRDWVGMATSLNILFHESEDTLNVQIGAGKWADKIGAGAVSLILLWPLAISAGYGAWEQMKMPDNVFDFIAARLSYK
jgi:ribosomal protein L40E